MKRIVCKKIVSMIIVSVICCMFFLSFAYAASSRNIIVPRYNKDTQFINVYLSNKQKDAKINIKTTVHLFSNKQYGKRARIYVTMRDNKNRWIWGGVKDTNWLGDVTLKLGKDHSMYRISIREVNVPGIWYWRTFNAYHHPEYFKIECTKNCYIK